MTPRPWRPLDREGVAGDRRGVAVPLEGPGVDDLAPLLLHRGQGEEGAGRDDADLLPELPDGGGQRGPRPARPRPWGSTRPPRPCCGRTARRGGRGAPATRRRPGDTSAVRRSLGASTPLESSWGRPTKGDAVPADPPPAVQVHVAERRHPPKPLRTAMLYPVGSQARRSRGFGGSLDSDAVRGLRCGRKPSARRSSAITPRYPVTTAATIGLPR